MRPPFAFTADVVQQMVELGGPVHHTAAGSCSADGYAVDIAYKPPAVDILRVVLWSCTRVGQNDFLERFLSMAQSYCIDASNVLSNCSPDDVMRIAFLLPAAHAKRFSAVLQQHWSTLLQARCRQAGHTDPMHTLLHALWTHRRSPTGPT